MRNEATEARSRSAQKIAANNLDSCAFHAGVCIVWEVPLLLQVSSIARIGTSKITF